MNTNALIGLVALVVVVGGGIWFFSSKDASGLPTGGVGIETSAEGTASFAEFLGRGGSWTCTIDVTNPEAPTEGVVFLSGENMRGDFTSRPTTMQGVEVASHMIRVDGFFYTWTNLAPQGMKIAAPTSIENPGPAGDVINLEAPVQYACQPWVEDASKFEPPSEITFMELPAGAIPSQPN